MDVSAARLAADSLRVLPRKQLSRVLGQMADLEGPAPLVERAVKAFVRLYDVDMSEVVEPPGGYASFNEFFTRRLRPGARRVDPEPASVVSPADGRLDDLGQLGPDARMTVKGQSYTVAQLLGDEADARRYAGGSFFVVYLSPRDYHRVHAPLGGKVSCIRHVGGTLYPVNALGTRYVPGLFARNERVAIFQETESHGQVASVMVGAMGVGRIGLSFDDLETNRGHSPGVRRYGELAPHLDRGEELGVFHLGSTVIVFIGPDSPVKMLREPGVQVRMGEPIARRVDG